VVRQTPHEKVSRRWENPGDTCDRIIWNPHLSVSHAKRNRHPALSPSSPLPPTPLHSAPSSNVLGEAPCTPVLLTRVQSVPAAVLHRLFCGASILCRVHKTSGAREAIDCVIEGGMEHSRRLSSYLSMAPRNRPVSAPQTVAGWNVCCMH
jgi:hypothetical protein